MENVQLLRVVFHIDRLLDLALARALAPLPQATPRLDRRPLPPTPSTLLGPLNHLSDDNGRVVDLPSTSNRSVPGPAIGPKVGLLVRCQNDRLGELPHLVLGRRHQRSRREDAVADVPYLIGEEIVENPVAAHDHQVPLVGRDAMHPTSPFDHLHSDAVVEVWVNILANSGYLQRGLHVAIDALHLGLEDLLEPRFRNRDLCSAQHDQLTVAHGYDRDHGMRLAVNLGAVVQQREHRSC
mmetsp:Transcript_62454/g.162301  ORF Transcript_62454/g.162301 Transcript_62454/m.162301 type:complete len:239 (-) Transcript_62454:336-1052(-)